MGVSDQRRHSTVHIGFGPFDERNASLVSFWRVEPPNLRALARRGRERLHSSGFPPTTPAAALVLGGEKAKDGSGGGRGGRPRDGDRVSGGALPPRRRLGAQILELLEGKTAKLGHRVSPSRSNPLCLTRLVARSPLSPGMRILSRAPVLGINSYWASIWGI